MTTSSSSKATLREQATRIVQELKKYKWPYGKDDITFAIVQDDKVIKMTLSKAVIQAEDSESLREVILKYMAGEAEQ